MRKLFSILAVALFAMFFLSQGANAMTLTVNLKTELRQVEKMLTEAQRKVLPKATTRALNRTLQQVNTAAAKSLAKETGLKQKEVKQRLFKIKAHNNNPTAILKATGKAFNLIRFKAKQTKRGVTAKAWGKRKNYRGAFIANQGRTVFLRTSKARTPIKAVYGPSIPKEFVRAATLKALNDTARKRFAINMEADLKFFISKLKT